MANIDGLPVNSAVTHAEFMARTEDTSTTGLVNFQNVTDSSDPTTGAIKTAGGLGVAKSLNVGQSASIGGELIVSGETTLNDTLNASAILADGNINTTANMNALDVNATGAVTALIEVITPLVSATTANIDTLNLTNALTVPSLTVTADTVIGGNLTVNGTTTTLNTATVDSEDPNITVNKNGNDLSSEGAGFTVDRTGTKGSLVYANALASKFKIGDLASEAEVVTVSHTQTLTNKTLTSPVLTTPSTDIISATEQGSTPATPASGVRKLYPKSDGFYQLDSTGLETKVGSGSGGGGVQNLITDGDAESGIANYTEGFYSAAARPAGAFTASSGAGAFAISTTTTNPINSLTTFLLTKSAGASRQGRAIERTVTLDQEYRTKILQMRIKYRVQSGTFVAGSSTTDSSAIFYIGEFNGTTWKYTEPSSFKALSNSATIVDYISGTFQVSNDTTQIKLISYVAETANSAWVLQCEFEITPSVYVYGTPITDWQQYTPTFVALGTVTSIDMRWRRVGQNVEIEGRFTNGTTTGVAATVSLPSGLVGLATNGFVCGNYGAQGSQTGSEVVYAPLGNNLYFGMANWGVPATGTQLGTGGFTSLNAKLPIQGWSSSVQMSDSADTRICFAKASFSATVIPTQAAEGSETLIQFSSAINDTHGALTTGAGSRFTAPTAGFYKASGALVEITGSGTYAVIGKLFKNGVQLNSRLFRLSVVNVDDGFTFADTVYLNAGDYVDIRVFQNSGSNKNFTVASWFNIEKLSGPSAIAANEKMVLHQENTAGTSIANSGDIVVPFATELYDSHGSFVTDTFTAQTADTYKISAHILYASSVYAAGNRITLLVYKNGSFVKYLNYQNIFAAVTAIMGVSGSTSLNLNAGDTIQIRTGNNRSAGATSLDTAAGANWVTIERIK